MSESALRGAVDWLLERQDGAGWWTAEMETNVTMTAEHLLLLRPRRHRPRLPRPHRL